MSRIRTIKKNGIPRYVIGDHFVYVAPFEVTLKEVRKKGGADLIFFSPPYDDARTYGNDVSWKFEDYQRLGDYVFRALKPGGHCLMNLDSPVREWREGFGSERGFTPWKVMLDWAERVGFRVPDRLAYGRMGSRGAYNGRFRNDWEPLLWFQKPGGTGTFDKWAIAEDSRYGTRSGSSAISRKKDGSFLRRKASGRATEEGKTHRGTFWNYGASVNASEISKYDHPATFSPRLAHDVIRCFSPSDGIVCDPFVGSGTTALSCVKFGRTFIGGDLFGKESGKPWALITAERMSKLMMRRGFGIFSQQPTKVIRTKVIG